MRISWEGRQEGAGGSRGERRWLSGFSASWQDLLQLLFCNPRFRTFPEPALLRCRVFCPWVITRRQKGGLRISLEMAAFFFSFFFF